VVTPHYFPLTYLLTPWRRVLLEKLTVNFAALLPSCSINFFSCEDSRNTEEDPDNQQMKEISRDIL
jgi:hypothetical protein